ncbi:MAG: DUF6273 domain-containing protein [Spirochaetales bacterium]|nr:DUF6273 domain-containing protein [Spirochaetales bacterium]
MKTIKTLIAAALTAMLASAFMGCSSDGGDSPALPPPHEHTYAAEWTSSETHHWHAATCGHTDQVKDKAEHDFPETWTEVTAATEEADGLEERFCSVCEYRETRIILMLGHNHNVDRNNWSFDETNHWHAADCGRPAHNEDLAPHTEDNGTVTTAPTCVTKGIKTYKCTVCDKVLRTEEIPATGHTEDTGTVTTAPTCVTKGVRTYMCTVCDGVARTEEIPATGHTEGNGTVTTAPTCVTKGVKTYKCTVCDEILRTEEIPKLYSSPIDAETGLAATKSSKYIYFGVFPKTVAAKTITVDENVSVTMGANTYYKGKNDENYYVKVKENACGTSTKYKYSDGTQAKQNSSNSYRWFKVEPIKWKVVTYSYRGKCLLLAEDILTANVPYYGLESDRTIAGKTVYANNYKYSTIRAYLNGKYESNDTQSKTAYENKGFLQTAFTAEAQNLIAVTTVDNDFFSTQDSGWNLIGTAEYACADTEDKIFLLSEKEATSYGFPAYNKYGSGNARIRKPTNYAMANYAGQDPSDGDYYGGWWWLRSPNDFASYRALYVDSDGAADRDMHSRVSNAYVGVVPALSISLQ